MSKQDLLDVADDFPFLISETLMFKLPGGTNTLSRFGSWGIIFKVSFYIILTAL